MHRQVAHSPPGRTRGGGVRGDERGRIAGAGRPARVQSAHTQAVRAARLQAGEDGVGVRGSCGDYMLPGACCESAHTYVCEHVCVHPFLHACVSAFRRCARVCKCVFLRICVCARVRAYVETRVIMCENAQCMHAFLLVPQVTWGAHAHAALGEFMCAQLCRPANPPPLTDLWCWWRAPGAQRWRSRRRPGAAGRRRTPRAGRRCRGCKAASWHLHGWRQRGAEE